MSTEIEKYVAAYRKIRDVIKEKELQYKEEVADLKEQQDMIATKLLEFCNESNLDSVKTKEGTISRRVSTRYWTSDWEQMHQFIKDHDAMYLLEPRIQQTNISTKTNQTIGSEYAKRKQLGMYNGYKF
jgi:hypothetical protein